MNTRGPLYQIARSMESYTNCENWYKRLLTTTGYKNLLLANCCQNLRTLFFKKTTLRDLTQTYYIGYFTY
jgi:hypothetical protein